MLHPGSGHGVHYVLGWGCQDRRPSEQARCLHDLGIASPPRSAFTPFEEHSSPAAVPHHCGRCLPVVTCHPCMTDGSDRSQPHRDPKTSTRASSHLPLRDNTCRNPVAISLVLMTADHVAVASVMFDTQTTEAVVVSIHNAELVDTAGLLHTHRSLRVPEGQ